MCLFFWICLWLLRHCAESFGRLRVVVVEMFLRSSHIESVPLSVNSARTQTHTHICDEMSNTTRPSSTEWITIIIYHLTRQIQKAFLPFSWLKLGAPQTRYPIIITIIIRLLLNNFVEDLVFQHLIFHVLRLLRLLHLLVSGSSIFSLVIVWVKSVWRCGSLFAHSNGFSSRLVFRCERRT